MEDKQESSGQPMGGHGKLKGGSPMTSETKQLSDHLAIFHRRWMDRKEASEYIGVSPRHFDGTIKPLLRPVALGGRIVFDAREIDAAMESKKLPDW